MNVTWQNTSLESLEIGATPLVRHFLRRLQLPELFEQHLPALPGRQPTVPSAHVLCVLLTNLLLGRQPLYALPTWAERRVPEHLGLQPDQMAALNDDRIGRALDHLYRADRASLLTALVIRAVREFDIRLDELHQDTTTVTFSGDYAKQPAADQLDRPPRITFGYNKDHRPDLKQLLFGITITADGAVPIHCKIYDGNTSDDQVHRETWSFLQQIIGHSNFLYVADSKLCTRENMSYISEKHGRFLTIMPRTRSEDKWFRDYLQTHPVDWQEVHRQPNPRRQDDPDIVYHGVESPQQSSEGYRVLWYRSSQKVETDRLWRQRRLERAHARLEGLHAVGRRREFQTEAQAREAANRIVTEEGVEDWIVIQIVGHTEQEYRQTRPGRPGPDTVYQRIETTRYKVYFKENDKAISLSEKCDGIFPLMTNDKDINLIDALRKYKYQPFVEKRHEQLKSVFGVMPVWVKNVERVASLLWLYYVVELVQALIEREVRRQMNHRSIESVAIYPESRHSDNPTTELVFNILEGLRRHRLLDNSGEELRCFYDGLPPAAQEVLELLGVSTAAYGLI